MALNVGVVRVRVLQRSRDPLGTANSEAIMYDLFTRLQRAVNAKIEDVVGSASLPIIARQCVYQINANLPLAQKVLGVRDANRDLYPMEFDQLRGLDRYWFRRFKDQLRWFALCGYDILVIGPPPDSLQEATAVTVVYNQVTSAITSDANTFQLQDENVQSVEELTEAILLCKARDFAGMKQALGRAVKSLGLEHVALRGMQEGVEPETDVEEQKNGGQIQN